MHYFVTVVDEYYSLPFVYPWVDTSSKTIISCLKSLFNMFDFPSVLHSDNAKCFVSREIKQSFTERGISMTFASVYNPHGIRSVNATTA